MNCPLFSIIQNVSAVTQTARCVVYFLLAVLAIMAASSRAYAADSDLDPTFGNGGVVAISIPANKLAIGTDGKIVVGGGGFLARFQANGDLDLTFGSAGSTLNVLGGGAIAIQEDGKIIVAGSRLKDIAIARYNTDGSLDAGFGNNGIAAANFGDALRIVAHASDVAIRPNGRIVVVGAADLSFCSFCHGFRAVGALIEFDINGSVFSSQEVVGFRTTDNSTDTYMELQPDGRVILARMTLPRILDISSVGDPNISVSELFGESQVINDLAVQSSNKVLIALNSTLYRYDLNGTHDLSFGSGTGQALIGQGKIAIQADDKIVVVNNMLARYTADGSLDPTFGNGGVVADGGIEVKIQSDGKYLVLTGSTLKRYKGTFRTPQEILGEVVASVDGLVSEGELNNGQGNALTAKLRSAIRQLDRGNAREAINELNAFINQVNALVRSGRLSQSQGQLLINEVEGVIASIRT